MHSTRAGPRKPYVVEDVKAVVADVLSEYVQEREERDLSLKSIVKAFIKEAVKGAVLGALQGLVEAVVSLAKSCGLAVRDFIERIWQWITQLLLQALRALKRLARELQERSGGKHASAAPAAEGAPDERDDFADEDNREPARRDTVGNS